MSKSYQTVAEEVGRYYDQEGEFYKVVLGNNLHFGYWQSADDPASILEAIEQLTDLMISSLDVGPDDHILDVGCGVGGPAVRLAKATGCSVTGIAVSHYQIEQATQLAEAEGLSDRLTFQHANAMDLPFEAESFDAAWAFESLHHMPDRLTVFHQVNRVLRPEARFVTADIIEGTPSIAAETSVDERTEAIDYLGNYNPDQFGQYTGWLETAGFKVIDLKDLGETTPRSVDGITQEMKRKRPALVARFGEEKTAQFIQNWVEGMEPLHKAGYIVAVAQKMA